jgi:hypothetical protein
MQHPDAHPDTRPGLKAFLESGATGMICTRGPLMVEKALESTVMEFLRAKGIAFRSAGSA